MALEIITREKPTTLDESHKLIDELYGLLERSHDQHKQQLDFLKQKLRQLANRIFAAKSDNVSVSLFNEAELIVTLAEEGDKAAAEESPKAGDGKSPAKGTKKPRKIIPDGLPVDRRVYDLAEEEKSRLNLHKIGEEVTRELDYTPGKFRVIEHVTIKYASRVHDDLVMQSQKPASLIPKSVAAPGLLSHILISKYENHLPLYRQEQMFARNGVHLTRDVMANWVIAFGKAIIPLINLLKDEQVASSSLQGDETPYRVLTIDGVNVSKKSYIWVTCRWGPKSIVLYHHARGRGSKYIKEILTDFKGFLQVDAYSGYDWVDSANSGIIRIGCMAHVRRQFTDFLKTMPKQARDGHPASRIVTLMKPLYAIEDKLRENPSLDRMQIRQEQATEHFSKLEEFLASELRSVAASGLYGKALNYASHELPKIKHYLSAAEIEIDNNLCENSIRPFCLGKKNWLFAETEDGGEASANIYSLVMTARANKLHVGNYFRMLIEKLPLCKTAEHYAALLPY